MRFRRLTYALGSSLPFAVSYSDLASLTRRIRGRIFLVSKRTILSAGLRRTMTRAKRAEDMEWSKTRKATL